MYFHRVNKDFQGVSLIDLMIAMTIAVILMSVAVPSYNTMIKKGRLTANFNGFIGGVHLTRSEAIKRGATTTLCKSVNGTSCVTTGGWGDGWVAFVDTDADGVLDTGEERLKVHEALDASSSLIGDTTIASILRYRSDGTSMESGTFTLCDDRGASYAKAVIISVVGRVRSSDTDTGGVSLSCP